MKQRLILRLSRMRQALSETSLRTKAEVLLAAFVIVYGSISTGLLISDHGTISALAASNSNQASTAKAQAKTLSRRSPATAFIACAVDRIGAYLYADTYLTAQGVLGGARPTAVQAEAVEALAGSIYTATRSTKDDGCLDPTLGIDVSPPLQVPGIPPPR